MNIDRRRWLALPSLAWLPLAARAQNNSGAPSALRTVEQSGEVQVGAGTQGDVTTGASGAKQSRNKSGSSPPADAVGGSPRAADMPRRSMRPESPARGPAR